MANGKITTSILVLLLISSLAACKFQGQQLQQVPKKFPSAWDTEAYSEGTSFENRIAWVRAENGYPKERLFLDTRTGSRESESWPVLRMSKPYGCEVDKIDVVVDRQLFKVEIWDHFTDVIITPAIESERISGSNASREALLESWDSAPFWQAFRSGERIALRLAWNCEYAEASPAQNGTLATFSLTGADYALYYVTGGPS